MGGVEAHGRRRRKHESQDERQRPNGGTRINNTLNKCDKYIFASVQN